MKRVTIIFLCLCLALSMIACQNNTPAATTETKDYSQFAGIVADPTGWVEEFEALPIANENMTVDELRQLAVDAFRADLTFRWTPNQPVIYTYSMGDVNLPIGMAYSGLCYATGVSGATVGNIYKALPYYDRETGTLDIEAMGDKFLGIISSACSYGAMQGWNRVSNSHGIGGMQTYNQYDSNIIPVGPYTYETYNYNHNFNTKTASREIIEFNGAQVMYESYAQTLPGDGLYTSPGWHVVMCSKAPVVVRNPDGSINPTKSYITLCGQGNDGTHLHPKLIIKQENGVDLCQLGSVDYKQTFAKLLLSGYIPFTIPEFVGEDPVEAGEVWLGSQASKMENGQDITAEDLFNKKLGGNYVICNIEVSVKDPEGNVLLNYDPSVATTPRGFELPNMKEGYQEEKLAPFANGKNTIHIYARLANGELLEAFNTVLKMD